MTSAPASTMPGARRGVLLGDWGHFGEVLAEIDASGGALSLVGSATDEASASVLLRDARPDFAIVSARPDRIPGLVALAARSGCHVVSEKPLALDIAALRSLFAAVAKSGVRVCPMLSNRTRPALAAAVAAIRAGVIGRPVLLSARKTYKWGASRPAWFGDRAAYGGTIPWIGIHALDFIDAATDGDPVAEGFGFSEQAAAFEHEVAPREDEVGGRLALPGVRDRRGDEPEDQQRDDELEHLREQQVERLEQPRPDLAGRAAVREQVAYGDAGEDGNDDFPEQPDFLLHTRI